MRSFLLSVFLLSLGFCAFGQTDEVAINIQVENYQHDTLIFGYHFGDKQYVQDTLIKQEGKFSLYKEEHLPGGIYLLILKPANSFVQVLLDKDQIFDVDFDADEPVKTFTVKGSELNHIFYDYLRWLTPHQKNLRNLNTKLHTKDTIYSEDAKEKLERDLVTIKGEINVYQKEVINESPRSLLTVLLRANLGYSPPVFEGSAEEIEEAKWRHYKEHYFDHVDVSDERLIRTPILNKRIHYYLDKLTIQHPDSLIYSLDLLLKRMSTNENSFTYGLPLLLNKYARSKIVGYDAIYVHLVDQYYSKGKASWADEEVINKLKKNVNKIRPLIIGKYAPRFSSFTQSGEKINLYDVQSKYTVLFFWAPDCSHCKKSTPDLISFHEKYKDLGVKVLAVCTKLGEKEKDCWEMIEEKGTDMLLNTSDPKATSRFQILYNIVSTPQIFILDSGKKILMKKIGTEQLDSVMSQIIDIDKQGVK